MSEQKRSHVVTRGVRSLTSLRADCGQEVQGAFSELVIRDEPRAGLCTLNHEYQYRLHLTASLETPGMPGTGKNRVEIEGKQERVNSNGKDSIPHSSLYKEAPLPWQFGLCFALARKTS